ncbi:MAG: acyltransferase family protein [Lachnospiraceae bacterium]|nr:acyltransferase family protein [Lachnospiraceae bacterium]
MGEIKQKERNISFDILRIISALSVVVLHVTTKYIMNHEVGSFDFRIANFINSISRFGVPVFVMISGAIFLSENKKITVKKLWLHNILRMFILYWIWSFAYYVFQSLYFWKFDFWNQGILRTVVGCVYASEHFWFLFMIIGLYALVPLLRTWVHNANKKELEYFIILFVFFQIIRTTLTILIDKSLIQKMLNDIQIIELSGYLGYFILGYYLIKFGLPKIIKIIIYCMLPFNVVFNFIISDYMSKLLGAYTPGIYDSFGIFTFINVIALFVFITDVFKNIKIKEKPQKLIQSVALDTLGIYIMHIALLDYIIGESIIVGQFGTFIEIILISIVCYMVCGLVSTILRRIPFVGRYMC